MTNIIRKINLKITFKKDILKKISVKKKQYIKNIYIYFSHYCGNRKIRVGTLLAKKNTIFKLFQPKNTLPTPL